VLLGLAVIYLRFDDAMERSVMTKEVNAAGAGVDGEEEEFAGFIEEEELDEAALEGVKFAAPEGFERVSVDVQAYWEPAISGPIVWVPQSVRLLDNSQSPEKSSALIIGELLEPAKLKANAQDKKDRVIKEFDKGTAVGVWAKAGMRELLTLGGAEVWMAPDGFRQLPGREKPMALFACHRKKGGAKGIILSLIEDARKTSVMEAVATEYPPWWLQVIEDGGVARAEEALAARTAASQARKGAKGRSSASAAS
jgi:hypothetical protein